LTSLADTLGELVPWTSANDLSPQAWDRYVAAARAVQRAAPAEVERAIQDVLATGSDAREGDDETRVFLLLRVVFDLPERAPADERRSYKGWVNWPAPDGDGCVSLAWPIAWRDGRPALVAGYEGSEGPRYAAVAEYRHLLDRYAFRDLHG
jgi:hypothetical protein